MQPAWNDEDGRIRLMIVDDVPDTTENVRKLLYFERGVEVVATAASGREAISKALHFGPDVVLMDINMPDMDGLRAAEIILQQVPTRVVMMSVQQEPEYLHRAMVAGARGYLIKPFSGDQLLSTLRSAALIPAPRIMDAQGAINGSRSEPGGRVAVMDRSPAAPAQPGRSRQQVIAVFSGKGGVGRSVIALNLAIVLRQLTQERVALVDADLQAGDIHIMMGMNIQSSIDDLREATSLDAVIIQQALATHEQSGIQVLRAPLQAESAELYTADEVKRIMVDLRENFDYLVVDMSAMYSDANLTILEMADQILLITTLEITALNKVTRFFEVAERLGFPEQKIVLVCNRAEAYYGIKPQQLQAQVRHVVAEELPEEIELMVGSINRGIPFVLQSRNHPLTKHLVSLAKQVVAISTQSEPARTGGSAGVTKKRKRGLFRR